MAGLSFLGIPLGFAQPWILVAIAALPVIWWLLRLTPPKPAQETFPPTRILAELVNREETPARSPWWLTLLRLLMAFLVIFAMSLPVWNPQSATLRGEGPVLLIVDNGWASGTDWPERMQNAQAIVDEAQAQQRQIILIATASNKQQKVEIISADNLRGKLASWENQPAFPDYSLIAKKIDQAIQSFDPSTIVFLSDGIAHPGHEKITNVLQTQPSQKILFQPNNNKTAVLNSISNEPDAMVGTISRIDPKNPETFGVTAFDIKGISVSRQNIQFPAGETSATFSFDIPVEVRNDIVRVALDNTTHAGAIQLLDESNRRRLVGLISGEKHDNSQPLLSPLYYISRALSPFSDIRRASDANVVLAVPELITSGVSTIVLADIGILPPQTAQKLQAWVNNGGMLIRFAGPRLAAAPHSTLLPVRLRQGDRNIGGALSWEKPKPVDKFELTSPFFGLEPPSEVFVSRQVLALQEGDLATKTWARLTDGTPLVTASKSKQGWIVLFHVSSDATWSNLPISGTFVEMLRRVVNQSRSFVANTAESEIALPPLRLLNGRGQLASPPIDAKPIKIAKGNKPTVTLENPPGFYGTNDGFRAVNLFNADADLQPLAAGIMGKETQHSGYGISDALALKPFALIILATLLVIDCIAVLWMAGLLKFLSPSLVKRKTARAAAFIITIILLNSSPLAPDFAYAQNAKSTIRELNLPENFDFSPSLKTRLAYVITGVASVDQTSEAGLRGLTKFLTERTAIEPGEPIGIDISSDELAFYPMIYWPIHTASELPDATTMARIDTYMKQGGSVIFDTRDQFSGFSTLNGSTPERIHLQRILSSLDIPPLEPVPPNHVLTKTFFILAQFPGRYSGGDLWVEQLPDSPDKFSNAARPVRTGDGVSSILITGNDFAGAWAINRQNMPMFPIVPPNPIQREIAFRVGVNLIMYAMTGNYKSDQVHIPALLERLGQ